MKPMLWICIITVILAAPLISQQTYLDIKKTESSTSDSRSQIAQKDEDIVFYFQSQDGNKLYLEMPLSEMSEIMCIEKLTDYKQTTDWGAVIYTYGAFEFTTGPEDYYEDAIVGIDLVKKDPHWQLIPKTINIGSSKEEVAQVLGKPTPNFTEDPDEWDYIYNSNTNLSIYFKNNRVIKISLWMGL